MFATGFVKKEHPKEYNYKNYLVGSRKVLKNGDVLPLLVCPYDVQLIRMKTDGSVSWNKQYAIDNATADPVRRSGSAMIVTDDTPGAQPMKFTKTSITPHAIEACNQ